MQKICTYLQQTQDLCMPLSCRLNVVTTVVYQANPMPDFLQAIQSSATVQVYNQYYNKAHFIIPNEGSTFEERPKVASYIDTKSS